MLGFVYLWPGFALLLDRLGVFGVYAWCFGGDCVGVVLFDLRWLIL